MTHSLTATAELRMARSSSIALRIMGVCLPPTSLSTSEQNKPSRAVFDTRTTSRVDGCGRATHRTNKKNSYEIIVMLNAVHWL